jgi:ubiquinone/menaquinone biosynthesis C-methylase UbiE
MSSAEKVTTAPLEEIADLLACPACRGELRLDAEEIHCAGCGATYGFHQGIPLFARRGSAESWGGSAGPGTSAAYQENYQGTDRAAGYNQKYEREFWKRMSTRREHRLLRKHLLALGRCQRLLDIPSGGGRLSAQIAPATDLLIEADIALGQVLYGRQRSAHAVPQIWMTASAFHIPLRDSSIDGAVCVRLCHHLPSAEERERLVRELLRVSRRFVIMTFFDEASPKNLIRRSLRRMGLSRKSPKKTMTVARLRELAREGGAVLTACPYLAYFGSGHRYASLIKPA